MLEQISDDHQYPDDPFVALADYKITLEKARKRTFDELLCKTPGGLGAKLLTASTNYDLQTQASWYVDGLL